MLRRSLKIASHIAAVIAAIAMCFVLAGCSQSADSNGVAENNGIAASILGEDIAEQSVTDYIETMRDVLGYSSEEAWKQYLEDNETTPSSLRDTTIFELAGDIVIQKKADEEGITVSDEEVDQQIQEFRESLYATDDETWQSTLENYKTTEDELKTRYRNGILQDKVYEKVVPKSKPTDQDITSYISENLLGTTAKKFEVLYCADYTTLQSILDDIQNSKNKSAAFAAAKKKADGKNLVYEEYGWDLDSETTTAMKNDLANLKKGGVSENLVSDTDVNSYEILHVIDVYKFPKKSAPKLKSLPKGVKSILKPLVKKRVWNISCSSWLSEQINQNITVNPMPSGLPYDVEVDVSADNASGNESGSGGDSSASASSSGGDSK